MLSLLNPIVAIIDIALLVWVLTALPMTSIGRWRVAFIAALLCAMAYDNLIVAGGAWLFDELWFYTASMLRFYCHVLILPFLSLFTYAIIREAGLPLGQSPLFLIGCCVMTVAALVFGISHELVGLALVENSQLGIRRMSNAAGSAPVATIVTNLFTIVVSAYLWRKTGWHLLFLGALFIFVVNGAGAGQAWGFIAGSVAEVVFMLSLILSHQHFNRAAQRPEATE